MNLQNISNDQVAAEFGTHHDGIWVYKNERRVGFISDLRLTMGRKIAQKVKQKEYTTAQAEARREAMPEAVKEMTEFLTNNVPEGKVFVNITQPNVRMNGHKVYVIVDPLSEKNHRLGIRHANLSTEEMAEELASYKVQQDETSQNHILLNGMTRDDIVEVIKKLCK